MTSPAAAARQSIDAQLGAAGWHVAPQVTSEARNKLVHDGRWNGYETPPTGNANYAWILHMVSKLSAWGGATKTTRQGCPKGERGGANQNGVAGFVLAKGSRSTDTKCEGGIRQKLVENKPVSNLDKVCPFKKSTSVHYCPMIFSIAA